MTTKTKSKTSFDVRKLVFTAMLSAVAFVLQKFLSFPLPFVPSFITFDFSDSAALMASLTMGPASGAVVCLVKNLLGLFGSTTGGVGEISNFILSCALVVPAGFIAKKTNSSKGVWISCLCGAVAMGLLGVVSNYFIVYPIYDATVMPMEVIIGMYKAILPSADSLIKCLLIFNLPFTFVKGLAAVFISAPLYKKLRPVFSSMEK